MAFVEERFNTEIRYGGSGGPEFRTVIGGVISGAEQRNSYWTHGRGRWSMAEDLYTAAEVKDLIAFFRARKGRAVGFRFKDWSDWYTVSYEKDNGATFPRTLLARPAGIVTSNQLYKRYYTSTVTYDRKIVKPVEAKVVLYNAGEVVSGASVSSITGVVADGTATHWEGEFDVPARFDVDVFNAEFSAYREEDREAMYYVTGLTVVELLML
jgi:uncharacterized protein (TIGR02217 family)